MKKLFIIIFFPFFVNAQSLSNRATEQVETFSYLGTFYNMYIGNRIPFTDIVAKGDKEWSMNGKFLIDYGTDTSVVDLNSFPGGYLYKMDNHQYSLTFKNGTLTQGPHVQYCYDNQTLSTIPANGIIENGIIGTDILSKIIATFDYRNSRFYIVWDSAVQCKPAKLIGEGFIAASTKGYFSSNPQELILIPKSNNPLVKIAIGDNQNSAEAWALIDPGYDDRCSLDGDFSNYYTHVININKKYFEHLKDKGVGITVDKKNYITLGNRSGKPDTLYQCSFKKRYTFNVIGTKDEPIIPYGTDECNVFLKVNSPGGQSAGGITILDFPAAQFGGSFLLDCDKVTFDPFRSLVWFQSKRRSSKRK